MEILFLHKQILFPHDTGGKIRVLNLLKHLAGRHEITYLCNLRPGEEVHRNEMHALGLRLETVPAREPVRGSWGYYRDAATNLFSPFPFTISKNFDPALRKRALELVATERYDLLICDTVVMARHVMELEGPARVLFQHNVEAQVLRRQAQMRAKWLRSRYMALQERRMRRFEAECGNHFDAVIAVSEQDRQTFASEYGWRHVQAIDTGVDVDYFRPRDNGEPGDRVVFVGSMDYLPNQDGVEFFVEQVWPTIYRAKPRATFQIVGRNPAPKVLRLQRVPGVEVAGTVPDVRPYLAGAAVVVVPLLAGGGTRIKIFEALAMGKAVVSTTIGAEGLPVTAGEHLVLADSPADLARAVTNLLNSPEQRTRLGRTAHRLVNESYSNETVARQFEQICQEALEKIKATPVPKA
jgi:sugar transferase (PEP-CTERM/EpsH1 system associated)